MVDLRGKLPSSRAYPWRSLPAIRYLAIHHTAGDERDFTAEEIARYHTQTLGWPGIGYHYVVHWDGTIDWTQDLTTMSWHIHDHNHDAVGICMAGDWTRRAPGERQIEAGQWLVGELLARLPGRSVVGHRDIAVPGWYTSCPGDTWPAWRPRLEAAG